MHPMFLLTKTVETCWQKSHLSAHNKEVLLHRRLFHIGNLHFGYLLPLTSKQWFHSHNSKRMKVMNTEQAWILDISLRLEVQIIRKTCFRNNFDLGKKGKMNAKAWHSQYLIEAGCGSCLLLGGFFLFLSHDTLSSLKPDLQLEGHQIKILTQSHTSTKASQFVIIISALARHPHQKNISGKHNKTEADEVLSACTDLALVATPPSVYTCTTKGYAHLYHLHKFHSDSRRHPKDQNFINTEKQKLQSEPTRNIQGHQAKLNSVRVVCSAKPNKGEQNLEGLEYDNNRIVHTSSALKSSLSSISPFFPGAFSREGIPMVWVCNIFGMIAFRSQFEASAHEVKCNASSQYTNLSTGDPICRNITDGYIVFQKLKSPAVTHYLQEGENEASAGPRKTADLDHRTWWEAWYKQLSEYNKRYGTCCVPKYYPEDPGLEIWVKVQRRSFRLHCAGEKNPLLSGQRLEKLESLGFVWDGPLNVQYSSRWKDKKLPPTQPKSWDVRFQLLKLFQERYNHCRVPQRYPVLWFLGKDPTDALQ